MDESADTTVVVVLTTAPDPDVAERIVSSLVEERLVACANIVPGVTSIYRWQGEVQRDSEVMVFLKSTEALAAPLRDRITQLHPYDLPEVLVLPVPDASDRYAEWVRGEVRSL